MAPLDESIGVTITVQATAVAQAGFGIPAVLAYHTVWPETYREYTSDADMVTDGFPSNHAAVLMVRAILSQANSPPRVVVGKRTLAFTHTEDLTPVAANSTKYSVYIADQAGNSGTAEYTSDATATVAEITLGLTTAINLLGVDVTATDNTTKVTLAADNAGEVFSMWVGDGATNRLIQRKNVTSDPGIATDITALVTATDAWYCLSIDSQSAAEIAAASASIEAMSKIFVANSADFDILTDAGGNLAETLAATSRKRTLLEHSLYPYEYTATGWAGLMLTTLPGSATWAYQEIVGTSVTYTQTEITNMISNNCNYRLNAKNTVFTLWGRAVGGRPMDITRGIDWLDDDIVTNILFQLVNSQKISYVDLGIAQIESAVRQSLTTGVQRGLIAEGFTVTVPAVADVSVVNKTNRLLEDVLFDATLQGAIEKVRVRGNVTV